MSWTRKTWAVNSKKLLSEITAVIEEGFDDMGVIWGSDTHRDSFVDLIDQWMEEKAIDGKIEQWKVICDFRNNKVVDMENGKFVFEIQYKQTHCVNVTRIEYTIIDDEDQLILDFEV